MLLLIIIMLLLLLLLLIRIIMKNHKECPEGEHGIPNWDWPVFRPKRLSLGLGFAYWE